MKKQKRILDFDIPTQVKFIDFDRDYDNGVNEDAYWIGGIAFHDKIICGCCGGTIDIQDYYDDWDSFGREQFEDCIEDGNPLVIYDYWVDINEEIKG